MANSAFLTIAREWDRLEPAMRPDEALERTKHAKLMPSTTYPMGQVLCVVIGGANAGKLAKPGTVISGSTLGPRRFILQYPCVTDAGGKAFLGTALPTVPGSYTGFDSVPVYFGGYFFIADLTGIGADADVAELGHFAQGGVYTETNAIVHLT
jgi:hypothetical protein